VCTLFIAVRTRNVATERYPVTMDIAGLVVLAFPGLVPEYHQPSANRQFPGGRPLGNPEEHGIRNGP
jgi:hypothetical protein